ncbi:MAG: UbiA family prenyltransferase [Deltaproteobacteria bacterium]|nr:UbiA family prenyltransferase [Deltaproteobacteria bacterium]
MSADSSLIPSSLFTDADVISRPLCVDLDGTLVTTDTLGESVVLLLRRLPWLCFLLPLWLLGGRAAFKAAVADRVSLDPAALPYRHDLLKALRFSRDKGRKLVLATAADLRIAQSVADHLGIFDAVHGSQGARNLKASEKGDLLCATYGKGGFDYVGDSTADAPIFALAAQGYLVGATRGAIAAANGLASVKVLSRRPSLLRAIVKELRLHQWSKNALVVVPLVLAPGAPNTPMLVRAMLAFLSFSCCASAGYVLNDLLDMGADRAHPTKRNRPFASGALPVLMGVPLLVALLGASFGLAGAFSSPSFVVMLGLYFAGTLSYSLFFKRKLMLDVLMLAGLYTHRILSGGVATGVHVSAWLLGFSMFIFTSLAFAKRFIELRGMTTDDTIENRGYSRTDLEMVTSMGTASGYIAALVFMLYVESAAVRASYREPTLLWLVLPILLYWLGRIWLLAGRGKMQDDPVKFALKDSHSLLCALFVGLIAALARFAPQQLSDALH